MINTRISSLQRLDQRFTDFVNIAGAEGQHHIAAT
jgi:hypothetical protein